MDVTLVKTAEGVYPEMTSNYRSYYGGPAATDRVEPGLL
jgi:hypothetical protein